MRDWIYLIVVGFAGHLWHAGAAPPTSDVGDVEVELDAGFVIGMKEEGVRVFRGIPFAKPPIGELRWHPPQPFPPWRPTRLVTKNYRHNCLQSSSPDFMGWPQPLSTLSEDCLYLNVYAPAEASNRFASPVMFWIYGGNFTGGGGNETRLNGVWDVALADGELSIVTSNYRLGAFGFLAADELRSFDPDGGTGNYGILDQRMALQWVKDNIDRFGCDPNRVFIVGQSAGANSVSQHLVRPKSWGLFASAGMESGAFYQGWDEPTVSDKRAVFLEFARQVQCDPANITCFLLAPALTVLEASMKLSDWEPVVDYVDHFDRGVELAQKGKLAPVPVLVGSVSEDGFGVPEPRCRPASCSKLDFRAWASEVFQLDEQEIYELESAYSDEVAMGGYTMWYWLMAHASADQWSGCFARRTALWATAAGQPAYFYRWSYAPQGRNGAFPQLAHHACEQPFVFHVLAETPREIADSGGVYHITSSEIPFSSAVVQYWRSMASRGRPVGDVAWPVFDDMYRSGLAILNSTGRMFEAKANLRGKQCGFWDKHFNQQFARFKGSSVVAPQLHALWV